MSLRVARRLGTLAAALALASITAGSVSASPAEIRAARAEAESVLAEIAEIDRNLELAVEAYNSATLRLDEIQADIEQQRAPPGDRPQRPTGSPSITSPSGWWRSTPRASSRRSRSSSARRASTSSSTGSTRPSASPSEDVRIVEQIRGARAEMRLRERKLAKARAEQKQVVAERGEQRESIEGQLAERQALYSSIKDQIVQLEAEERERQRRLAEEQSRRQEEQQRIAGRRRVGWRGGPGGRRRPPEGIGTAPPAVWGGVVAIAMQYLGVPYVWGGASPSGFDCSGLVVYAFAQAGRPGLPHYTGSLWQMGVPSPATSSQPGDLVFFNGLGHMGIYIGGGQMIHAPHTGDVVKISDITAATTSPATSAPAASPNGRPTSAQLRRRDRPPGRVYNEARREVM